MKLKKKDLEFSGKLNCSDKSLNIGKSTKPTISTTNQNNFKKGILGIFGTKKMNPLIQPHNQSALLLAGGSTSSPSAFKADIVSVGVPPFEKKQVGEIDGCAADSRLLAENEKYVQIELEDEYTIDDR